MFVRGYMQALSEPLSDLLGGAALTPLDLLDGVFGAADPIGKVELRQVKLFAALP
jgi:hypothetical protein